MLLLGGYGAINIITLRKLYSIITPVIPLLIIFRLYRRLLLGQDSHLDQSEAYDIS